ncbi:MAG: hypothetical protein HQL70_08130 [Magnetococcales bacterium]|nr:hypothetical protein [Magnetococcales bacterium]
MAISDLARIQGLTLDVGRASPRTLNAVKSKAHKLTETIEGLTAQSSGKTSNLTKGFARKAYTITLSPSDTRSGPTYSPPK